MIIDYERLDDYSKEELIELIQSHEAMINQDEFPFTKYLSLMEWDFSNNLLVIDDNYSEHLINAIGMRVTSIHPDDQQRIIRELNNFRKNNEPFFIIEFRINLENNLYKWMEFVGMIQNYVESKQEFNLLGIHKFSHKESENIEKLKVERAKFKQLFDHFNAGVVLLDRDNTVLDINKKFTNLFEYAFEEAEGRNIDDLITPDELNVEGLKYTQQVINGQSIEVETVRESKSGEKKDVFINAFPIKLESNQIGGYAIYYDISDRKEYERNIQYLSFHDELTGLYNRRYFENELKRLDDSRKLPISIIMGDMNRLKHINDNYGHKTGDEYLKIIGKLLQKELRTEDIVARVGGDEFVIILPETTKEKSKMICNRLLKRIKTYNNNNSLPEPLEMSLGCSTKTSKSRKLEKVFNEADRKMYEMKDSDECK